MLAPVSLRPLTVAEGEDAFPKIDVLLNGRWFGQLFYNVKGYRGYLPAVPEKAGGKPELMPVAEVPAGDPLNRLVAKVNAEWAARGC